VAAALAAVTGERWSGLPDTDCYSPHFRLIRDRDGLTLSAQLNAHKRPACWNVSPASVTTEDAKRLWLHDHRRHDEDTSANIGQAKSPAQIAKDITRRVLPLAEELARRAYESEAVMRDRKAWLNATGTQLHNATAPRLELKAYGQPERGSIKQEYRAWGTPYVAVTLDAYDRRVDVELHDLAPEVAFQLLAQLPPQESDT